MKKLLIFISSLMISFVMFGQTVLINPAQEGGFEIGSDFPANGWILVNGAQPNRWFVGTLPASPNNNSAFISNDLGVSWAYTITTASVVHFYRDITFPAGETDIQLTFLLRGIGESTFDRLRIYLVPTTTTPVAGTELLIGNQVGLANYNLQEQWIKVGLSIPATAAGTTQRLVFSWRNDALAGTSPPVSIDNISLKSQVPINLTGLYTINNTLPTAGTNFNSFNDAVLTLNSAIIGGPVNFSVTSGQQFVEILPIITATGTSANTISFVKSAVANPIILTGGFSPLTDAAIAIRGGDYFTFNGIDIGLAVPTQNTVENGFYVINASATNGAQFNTFTNSNIILNRANTTSRGVFQNVVTTPTAPTGANSNNVYSNINVSNSYHGIVCTGNATHPDLSIVISNSIVGAVTPNDIGNGTGAVSGIRITSGRDVMVHGNIVRNLTISGGANVFGIFMENIQGNSQIYKNRVYNLTSTNVSTSAFLQGIRADVNAGFQAAVFNNVVYGFTHAITTPSATMVARGITANAGTGTGTVGIAYNSVHMNLGAAATNTALWTGGGTHTITNNIFANTSTPGATSSRHCIFRSGTGVLTSNFNNFYIEPGTNNWVGFFTVNQVDLPAWQTASGGDLNSVNINPIFTGSPDLMPSHPFLNNLGTVVPITDDITGAPRHSSTPDMGAYEFTPPACLQSFSLTATSITNSSATLGWTSILGTLWNVEVGLPGFTPGTGTSIVSVTGTTSNTWLATGLATGTSYQFYVQDDCGVGGLSLWTGPFAFATQPVSPAPYFEGFPVTATPPGYSITNMTIGSVRGVLGNPANNIFRNLHSTVTTTSFTTTNIGPLSAGMILFFEYRLANFTTPFAPPAVGSGNFTVEISTDFGSTYTVLDTVINNGIAGYQPKQYDLSAYNGQIVRLRFFGQWISGNYDIAFDNISISTCPAPTTLAATAITQNTANLSWASIGTLWNVEVGLPGFTPGTGTSVVSVTGTTANSWIATGLTTGTNYQFYVQADCGVGNMSTWAGPFAFATQFLSPAPYFEGFPVTATPPGYTITGWTIGSARGVLGNPANNIFRNLWTGSPTGTFTTTNIGPLSAGMVLTFDYRLANFASPFAPPAVGSGNFTLEISTDFGSTYTPLDTVINNGIAGYQYLEYDLSAYNGQIVRLRFSGQRISGDYDLAFDNITITNCPAPRILTATAITQTTANLGWTSSGTLWNVEVGLPGFTPGTGTSVVSVTGTTNNPWIATGLTAATSYQFYVQADCGAGGLSTWTGPFAFGTTCPTTPNTIPFFEGFEGVVCWSALNQDGGGVNWVIATGQNHTPGGSRAAVHNFGASGYAETGFLFTPDIILPAGGIYELSFWSFIVDANFYGKNTVFVSRDGFVTSSDSIWAPVSVPESSWTQTVLNLSAYAGDTITIAFRYQGTFAHRWWLDDVRVRELVPATINPIAANYDLTFPADVPTTVTWNDASAITSIVDNQTVPVTLIANTHYTIVGNTLTLLDAYLSTVLTAVPDTVVLTINFNVGIATLTITAIQTPLVGATINPIAANYDLTFPADVPTTVTWNDASAITSIVDNQTVPVTLIANTHYTIVGNTLTLLDAYLSTVLIAVPDTVVLTINFDVGVAIFTITAIDTIVSVSEIISDINVFPNPSSGQFIIESSDNWTMMIYDITGRMVASQQITVGTNDVHLLNQTSGIYFIRLFNTTQIHTIKMVIE